MHPAALPGDPATKNIRMKRPVAIIGYSGHAHTGVDLLTSAGYTVTAYCDNSAKEHNPFNLE